MSFLQQSLGSNPAFNIQQLSRHNQIVSDAITWERFQIINKRMRVNIALAQEKMEPNQNGKMQQIAYEQLQDSSIPSSLGDPHFPHSLTSISSSASEKTIVWSPAQKYCSHPNYSDDIDDLQQAELYNKALTQALLLINWFVPEAFSQFFQERRVKPGGLFEYKVMINGVIIRLYIDSFVPFKFNEPIFAKKIGNSIFPCLYQKLMAKVWGNYQNIPQNIIDILEVLSCYSKQIISFYEHSQKEYAQLFKKILKNQSLIFFRTRNSVGLQTLGLESDFTYIITRVVEVKGLQMVQFLELQGQKWIGKFSKIRSFWQVKHQQVEQQEININQGSKENFMQIKDLINLTRQFIILHRTNDTHKIWLTTENAKTKYVYFLAINQGISTEIMVNAHFADKKCRSTMFLMEENRSLLISRSFKQNKNGNFIDAKIMCKRSYLLFLYVEDLEGKAVDVVLTVFSSTCEITAEQIKTGTMPEEKCFLNLMNQINPPKTYLSSTNPHHYICVKNLFKQIGMGFLTIKIDKGFTGKVRIIMDHEELAKFGITSLNTLGTQLEYYSPYKSIIMFKIKGNFVKGDIFPPPSGLKVVLMEDNKHKLIWK